MSRALIRRAWCPRRMARCRRARRPFSVRGPRQRLEAAASPGAPRTVCLRQKLQERRKDPPPLEVSEKAHSRRHFGFRPPAPRAVRQIISIVFSLRVWGPLQCSHRTLTLMKNAQGPRCEKHTRRSAQKFSFNPFRVGPALPRFCSRRAPSMGKHPSHALGKD